MTTHQLEELGFEPEGIYDAWELVIEESECMYNQEDDGFYVLTWWGNKEVLQIEVDGRDEEIQFEGYDYKEVLNEINNIKTNAMWFIETMRKLDPLNWGPNTTIND